MARRKGPSVVKLTCKSCGDGFVVSESSYRARVGRKLFDHETVHHINGVRADNRDENLELWSGRQPGGQRVEDKIAFCVAFLKDYPEDLENLGYRLAADHDRPEVNIHPASEYTSFVGMIN